MGAKEFEARLRALLAGEIEIKGGFNEYVGHAEVLGLLLEVAPEAIREDLEFLHDLMVDARDGATAVPISTAARTRRCRSTAIRNWPAGKARAAATTPGTSHVSAGRPLW